MIYWIFFIVAGASIVISSKIMRDGKAVKQRLLAPAVN